MHDQLVWRDYTVQFTESVDSLDLTGPRIRRDSAVTRGLTGLQMAKRACGILQTKRTKGLNRFKRIEGIRRIEYRKDYEGQRGQTRLCKRLQ
jgi:hypothetical protein